MSINRPVVIIAAVVVAAVVLLFFGTEAAAVVVTPTPVRVVRPTPTLTAMGGD